MKLFTIFVLCLLGILSVLYFFVLYYDEPAQYTAVSPLFSSSEKEPAEKLIAKAWANTNQIRHGEILSVFFEFENRTGEDIKQLSISEFAVAPGFHLADWKLTGAGTAGQTGSPPAFAQLPAGGSVHFSAQLEPDARSGSYSVIAIYAWSTQDGNERHGALTLGPFRVTETWREELLRIGRPFQLFVTGLVLPISIGLLAWFLNSWEEKKESAEKVLADQRMRDEKALADQRMRDEKALADQRMLDQKMLAEERMLHQQTWHSLLPRSLEYNQKAYLPVLSALIVLNRYLPKTQAGGTVHSTQREALYGLLLLLRRIQNMREVAGGLHFKSRLGEDLAATCWLQWIIILEKRFTARELSACVDLISINESYVSFEGKFGDLRTAPLLLDMERKFANWLDGPINALGLKQFQNYEVLLEAFKLVMEFEINRPLETWYGKPEPTDEIRNFEKKLIKPEGMDEKGWKKIVDAFSSYLADLDESRPSQSKSKTTAGAGSSPPSASG